MDLSGLDDSWVSRLLALINFPHPSNLNPMPPSLPPLTLDSPPPPELALLLPPPPPGFSQSPVTLPSPLHPSSPITLVAKPAPTEKLDQDQIWQKVLYRLATKSARALMEQRVKLVSMQGSRAKISSPPELQLMVGDRIDQVEEAFSQVMGYPVKITVETAPENNS